MQKDLVIQKHRPTRVPCWIVAKQTWKMENFFSHKPKDMHRINVNNARKSYHRSSCHLTKQTSQVNKWIYAYSKYKTKPIWTTITHKCLQLLSQFKPTSKSKASRSIGIVYFRAKFCITPVRNAWVKKKPETQNTLGLSSLNQFCKNNSKYTI